MPPYGWQVLAQEEIDKLTAAKSALEHQLAELETTGNAAAKRLRQAELEGGNVRSLASAAVEKLASLEQAVRTQGA